MGCHSTKPDESKKEELDIFTLTEHSLGLQKKFSLEIDSIFHRFSKSSTLTHPEFLKACEHLHLDPTPGFYQNFVIKKSNPDQEYSKQQLCTLGILLGSGLEIEKAKLMFFNYDLEIKSVIDKNTIRKMLDCILKIALICIPSIISTADMKILSEIKELNAMKPVILNHFENVFCLGKKQILLQQYLELFDREDVKALMNTKELRKFSLNYVIKPSGSPQKSLRNSKTQSFDIDSSTKSAFSLALKLKK